MASYLFRQCIHVCGRESSDRVRRFCLGGLLLWAEFVAGSSRRAMGSLAVGRGPVSSPVMGAANAAAEGMVRRAVVAISVGVGVVGAPLSGRDVTGGCGVGASSCAAARRSDAVVADRLSSSDDRQRYICWRSSTGSAMRTMNIGED